MKGLSHLVLCREEEKRFSLFCLEGLRGQVLVFKPDCPSGSPGEVFGFGVFLCFFYSRSSVFIFLVIYPDTISNLQEKLQEQYKKLYTFTQIH